LFKSVFLDNSVLPFCHLKTGYLLSILNLKIKFMQTSQSFGIHFTTRPDKARDGKEPIYACVTVNKQRAYIALKYNVDPKNWDSGKGTAKGNKDEVKSINNYLGEIRNTISNKYKQLQLTGKMLSAKAVKDLYLGAEEEVYMAIPGGLTRQFRGMSSSDLCWR
jgi:hypothetical protein